MYIWTTVILYHTLVPVKNLECSDTKDGNRCSTYSSYKGPRMPIILECYPMFLLIVKSGDQS